MKKYKILIVCVLIIALVIGAIVILKKDKGSTYLVLGDYISNDQIIGNSKIDSFSYEVEKYLKDNKLVNGVNRSYLSNNMTSKKLLEMIEGDVYGVDNIKILDAIKNSKYITITLGVNDVINNVKHDKLNDKLIYNVDVIKSKTEIFKHNYYKIIEEIKDINDDIEVVLVGTYYVYSDDYVFSLINSSIQEVANYYNFEYIDLSDINDKCLYLDNHLYLNSLGQEIVSKKVISKIKEMN